MRGDDGAVAEKAGAGAAQAGWVLRVPQRETPGVPQLKAPGAPQRETPGAAGDGKARGGGRRLSDFVPDKTKWWMLILAAEDHLDALRELPDDPGGFYDIQSPGFRSGMLRAFQ